VTYSGSFRFWVRAITLAITSLVAVALILRAAHNDYAFYLAYLVFQYVALALGWNILGGYAGFVNFGASAFFAAGAYSTVALNKTFGAPLPLCVAAGGAVGATLGLLMGALTLRLRGVYFAISTLSLSMVLETLVVNWSYVGGSGGAYLIRPKVFAPFTTFTEYLCLTMFVVAAGAAVASAAIERSSIGTGLAAIRDDETAAAALGVPTLWLKLVAATISGAILGMAGTPLPFYNSYVNPDSAFAIGYSVNALAMAVIGLVFMAFVALAPRGLIGLLRARGRSRGGP
jgi:branched-chain amino acid transport system permease protein